MVKKIESQDGTPPRQACVIEAPVFFFFVSLVVSSLGFRVWGSGLFFLVLGFGLRVWGLRFGV